MRFAVLVGPIVGIVAGLKGFSIGLTILLAVAAAIVVGSIEFLVTRWMDRDLG